MKKDDDIRALHTYIQSCSAGSMLALGGTDMTSAGKHNDNILKNV